MGMMLWVAIALALAGCAPDGLGNVGYATIAVSADRVALASTTALSLAELAYNSGEATATAAIRSGTLSTQQDAAIGRAVIAARGYRDQARALVAAGGDASAAIESLDAALVDVHAIAGA